MTSLVFDEAGEFSWTNTTGVEKEVTIHAWAGGAGSQGLNGFLWDDQTYSTSSCSSACVVHVVTVPNGSILSGTIGNGGTKGSATTDNDPASWGTDGEDTEIYLDDELIVFVKGTHAMQSSTESILGDADAALCIGQTVYKGGGGCGGGDGQGQGAGAPGTPIADGLGDQPYGPINPDGTRGGCGGSEENSNNDPIRAAEWLLGDWDGKFPGASGGSNSAGEGGNGHAGAVFLFFESEDDLDNCQLAWLGFNKPLKRIIPSGLTSITQAEQQIFLHGLCALWDEYIPVITNYVRNAPFIVNLGTMMNR